MQKKILLGLLGLSLLENIFFAGWQIYGEWQDQKLDTQRALEAKKIYPEAKIFGADFALKDYSGTKFTLEEEGKTIIKNAREFHSSPALIKGENADKYLCAGFLYEFSAKLWDTSAPISIGMMDPVSKTAADAWELPYAYAYVGGKVLTDLSEKFSLEAKDFWEKIEKKDLEVFFAQTFTEEALLGDIGFLYRDTAFGEELKKYGFANSHIVKNLGVSDFSFQISGETQGKTSSQIFAETLACKTDIFEKMKNLLEYYDMTLDTQKVRWYHNDFYEIREDGALGKKVDFQKFSRISLSDVTMIHFFEGARVDSLFQLSCQGDFFPINVIQINPRFIEKM